MYTSQVSISITGHSLNKGIEQQISFLIHQLKDHSPSDSRLQLKIVSGDSLISGSLSITSNAVNSDSFINGTEPLAVVKRLIEDSQLHLNEWLLKRRV